MKTLRVPLAFFLLTFWAGAQEAPLPEVAAPPLATTSSPLRSAQELDQMLAPIALYPDALIALILPASTVPTDIVLAARHLRDNPSDRSQIEHRAWDESVKSLTNYPEVVQWMDDNLQWTRQLGEAFAAQPADVMEAVQHLRAKARAAGTLVDTPQQQIIAEPQVIRIVPAQPDIIYVPHYEPEVVFVDRPVYYSQPFLSFGFGVPVGSWLAFDCDWRRHSIWMGDRHRRWTGHDWHRPVVPIASSSHFTRNPAVREWRPPLQTVRPSVTVASRMRPEVVRPQPFGLATARANTYRDSGPTTRRADSTTPAIAPPLPRRFNSSVRGEPMGPHPAPQFAAPAVVPPPQVSAPIAPAPTTQPANPPRRFGREWSRGDDANARPRDDNRSRNVGSNPAPANSTTPAVAPALPMHSPRPAQPMGPMPARTFSNPAPTPRVAPALPLQGRSVPPATRPAAPPPQAAPAPAPQPAAQPAAPVQRDGGESRGHRGSFRRDNS